MTKVDVLSIYPMHMSWGNSGPKANLNIFSFPSMSFSTADYLLQQTFILQPSLTAKNLELSKIGTGGT